MRHHAFLNNTGMRAAIVDKAARGGPPNSGSTGFDCEALNGKVTWTSTSTRHALPSTPLQQIRSYVIVQLAAPKCKDRRPIIDPVDRAADGARLGCAGALIRFRRHHSPRLSSTTIVDLAATEAFGAPSTFIAENAMTPNQNAIDRAPASFAESGVPACAVSACP